MQITVLKGTLKFSPFLTSLSFAKKILHNSVVVKKKTLGQSKAQLKLLGKAGAKYDY